MKYPFRQLAFALLACGALARAVAAESLTPIQVTTCSSERKGEMTRCPVDLRSGIYVANQAKECVEGSTWGAASDHVWVKDGCSADFLTHQARSATNKYVYMGKSSQSSINTLIDRSKQAGAGNVQNIGTVVIGVYNADPSSFVTEQELRDRRDKDYKDLLDELIEQRRELDEQRSDAEEQRQWIKELEDRIDRSRRDRR